MLTGQACHERLFMAWQVRGFPRRSARASWTGEEARAVWGQPSGFQSRPVDRQAAWQLGQPEPRRLLARLAVVRDLYRPAPRLDG